MLKLDHPEIKKTTFNRKCPNGHYKVALLLDPHGKKDYHFLRQDNTGVWSHKAGVQEPKQTDGSGNPIIIPHLADHKYTYYNYSKFCDYYCIKNDSWKGFQK
jgi:hypothetical protein